MRPTWSRPTIRINVLFFAQARERARRPSLVLELPDGSLVSDALRAVKQAHPELDDLWPHLAIAVDGVLAPSKGVLRDGAEVALLPPVSGG